MLTEFPRQKLFFQVQSGIFAATLVLMVPGALGLYNTLRDARKVNMQIALGIWGVGIALGLVVMIIQYSAVFLSNRYQAATTDAERAGLAAAADLVLGLSAAGFILTQFLIAIPVLMVSLVMLRAQFRRVTGYLGILSGVVGVVGSIPVPVLETIGFLFFLLLIVWVMLVALDLRKLG
jgi:hypothetical protein